MSDSLIVKIPFSGFYESLWSGEIDLQEEQFAEYEAESDDRQEGIAPELRLDAEEIAEILLRVTGYPAAFDALAKDYVTAFDAWAGDQIGMTKPATRQRYNWETREFETEDYRADSLGLTFESMSSPQFYNFETDRIFCHVPTDTVKALFLLSKRDGHEKLKATIEERCTSRSGFISFYSSDLADWLAKPVEQWDHNELSILLVAVCGEPDDMDIYHMLPDEAGYHAWESAVDWVEYDLRVAAIREEKIAKLRESNPEYDPPYRCPATPDLFEGAR
ncbi:hypothetical protein [Amorphus orientalis]|uniref:Uncharacterized protein n=1 Tax=Amorphus orientalis TaxID=649198 RepID=A0AAE3VT85_9HYPH|nr:hypothetical protein [Amorphus orientalis]MDQ0317765.1 hypothetical protein [Amorphus orientalis]